MSNLGIKDNIDQNTTGLLAECSYGVDYTTYFGLLGGHHQVYPVGAGIIF